MFSTTRRLDSDAVRLTGDVGRTKNNPNAIVFVDVHNRKDIQSHRQLEIHIDIPDGYVAKESFADGVHDGVLTVFINYLSNYDKRVGVFSSNGKTSLRFLASNILEKVEVDEYSSSDSDCEEEDTQVEMCHQQTFPSRRVDTVVRQSADDLTCGMRCLQNLCGRDIVTRDVMNTRAKELEKQSFGTKMYHEELGYYAAEVLESVLKSKGKQVQRIALHKIPSEYFHKAIRMNNHFEGYVVTLGSDELKHYVAVKYQDGGFRKLDSMPGVPPKDIAVQALFQRRSDGNIYCSMDASDIEPVVAVMAVGTDPFVAYNVMHDSWKTPPPTPKRYIQAIHYVTHPRLIAIRQKATKAGLIDWYERQKTNCTMPDAKTMAFMVEQVHSQISDEKDILIQMGDQQTIVRCNSVEGLMRELKTMQWVSDSHDCYFLQNQRHLVDDDGDEMTIHSDGLFETFSLDTSQPIQLISESVGISQAQVGGFYSFTCKIEGTCVGTQHNSYSIRDKTGNVHIVYKNSIETLTQ